MMMVLIRSATLGAKFVDDPSSLAETTAEWPFCVLMLDSMPVQLLHDRVHGR